MNRELDASMRLKLVGTASEIPLENHPVTSHRTVHTKNCRPRPENNLWLPNMFPDTLASRQHMAEITSSYVVDFS